ncbi:hypothetical protein [Microbacterium karelineae]|uniref:hypothetical protein n=1 Tax=Microbacterium karelineae TaxID=2654283 RepID=UPI001E4D75F0|nr:hypothetical protein [Microbacterium karelineae]
MEERHGDAEPAQEFEAALAPTEEPQDAPEEVQKKGAAAGWGRVFRGNRMLWVTAGVAVVALAAGLVLGRFVVSPFDAAAAGGTPDPGLPTVPVEFGELRNDITMRGDIAYADAVEVTLDTSSFAGAAIVTGQVPEAGTEIDTLSVVLEVAGRPVIALPGELPVYRTLKVGASGPDVTQLKEALAAAGIDPGDASSDVFDEATANAVGRLYAEAGYSAPEPEEGAEDMLRSAEDARLQAEQSVTDAQKALEEAGRGPSEIEVREADNQVNSLWRQIVELEREGQDASDLRDQLEVAKLQRAALDEPRDTSAEQTMLASAQSGLASADEALADARVDALPFLPASEVLFLDDLPRRVDAVNVTRGSSLEGAAMTVSGATVKVSGTIAQAEAELIEEGDEAAIALPSGDEHRAVVTNIKTGDDGDRATVTFEPDPFTPEQMEEVQGSNARLTIPVGATEGEVLSVPYAALTAGPGGESRVEVVRGDPRDGESADTELIVVETGLAADGYVEVTPTEGELEAGDLVVVGS